MGDFFAGIFCDYVAGVDGSAQANSIKVTPHSMLLMARSFKRRTEQEADDLSSSWLPWRRTQARMLHKKVVMMIPIIFILESHPECKGL